MTEDLKNDVDIIITDKASVDAASPVDSSVDDDIETYKKKLEEANKKIEEERLARERAEKERDERDKAVRDAQSESQTAHGHAIKNKEDAILNSLSAAKSRFEAAQAEWDDAYDSGDRARMREANVKLNDAQAAMRGAEFQKDQFEVWKEAQKKVVSQPQSASRYSKGEQDWIDRHPRFNTDRKYKAVVYAADEEAKEKGIRPDTAEYYRYIEKALEDEGLEGGAAQQNSELTTKKEEKKPLKSSSAAPVSSSSSASNDAGGTKRSFHMTPEHREAAAVCYPDLYRTDPRAAEEKYAARQIQIQELKRQGKI